VRTATTRRLWYKATIRICIRIHIHIHIFPLSLSPFSVFFIVLIIVLMHQPPSRCCYQISAVVLSDIRKGTLVKSLCANISTQMLRDFNYALVWGKSAVHAPQRCGLTHKLDDEDVVQIVTKTIKQQQNSSSYSLIAQEFQDKHAKKRLEAKKQKQRKLGR
jgi:hypothetical protein